VGFKPIIAAAPYRQLITLCGAMAEKQGYKVGYIVGGMSDKQRTETRLAFQANKMDLICVTTGAGGTGLTLTATDLVAFVARPWPYVEALQMEDRAHRRGQYKNVHIVDFESRRSIEARVREKLHEKAGNLAQLLQDPRIAVEFLGGQRKVRS
jgi:SNF2 family DNA or RNA helicase